MNDSDTSFKPLFDAEPAPAQENLVFEKSLAQPLVPKVPAGLGAQLSAKREELGLSVDQVAAQLNLALRQVKALEADDFDALPGMASVRGFVRSYAKLLKIAPEPLLAMLASPTQLSLVEIPSMRRALSTPFLSDSRLPIMGSQSRGKRKRLLLPAVILLLLALFGGYQMGWYMPGFATSSPNAAADSAENDTKAASASQSAPLTSSPLESVAPATKSIQPNGSVLAPVEARREPPAPPTVALVIKFREDSWIELRRNDGSARTAIITAHVGKAGTTESFSQDDARSLTIGNAKGVDVLVHGTPLDLGTNANGNVVRINLK